MPLRHRRPLSILTAVLLIGGLAACSTERYAEPIKGFSAAATEASTAVSQMNKTLADATFDYALKAAENPSLGSLDLMQDDLCGAFVPNAQKPARCRAVFKIQPLPGEAPVAITREQYTNPLGNMVAIMAAVQGYAANLAAVQSDNTKAEVNASIDKIQANLVKLVQATDPTAPIPAGLPEAAGEGVKWAFGQYIESVKFNALQKATRAAAAPLDDAAFAFKEIAASVKSQISLTVMADAAKAMRTRTDNSIGSNRAALSQANAYDDLLTAPLSPMLDNLVAAHKQLEEALNGDGEVTLSEVFSRFEEIKVQAEEVARIAKNINAALNPKTT